MLDIGELVGGGVCAKEAEVCPPEYENYVPCYYNVTDVIISYRAKRRKR